ncbi:hypothetical protein SAMN04490357_7676 [Streptomyces misionensis]|uniref:Uncharacterized protein n=1 Tax=Streptomyces misionensis TaxID=67331 RepID=A0A1H5K2H4_9ACTN|nr:hypothetical protein [Streptomyces misionensis]SEE59012.1 hypothetical protein SAMN04490357_7676 [Streptomyces misionensis]
MNETTAAQSNPAPADADFLRQVLAEARLIESAFETTPGAATAPAAPTVPVPPPGYTLRTIHHTTPDGGARVEYEVVPLAPLAPAGAPAETEKATAARRGLPDWLTANSRKIKAVAYLAGGGAITAGAALYGPAVGAGISAAAAGVWAATVLVLKVVGIFLGGLLVLRVLCGGGRRKKSGTFEFTGTGTWKEN